MKNGQRGAAFERRVAAHLEGLGYVVTRSAGSHGAADLVACRAGVTLYVQAKIAASDSPVKSLRKAEWDDLLATAEQAGAWAVLVSRGAKPWCELLWWRIDGEKRPRLQMSKQPVQVFDPEEVTP